jgi:hypothetical protein
MESAFFVGDVCSKGESEIIMGLMLVMKIPELVNRFDGDD